ncbi:methionine biosynthesis MetW [Allostella sp. ATCC 35155]|nr:methionine biosynthesis MetW [Stella sp. ATCC 35155]
MSGVAERAAAAALRVDLQIIADMIPEGARVLDVGCEDGALLAHLVRGKNVDGRGVELSQAGVNVCVSNGLSVIQGDADTDLGGYPSDVFDFVVLSQTLQATRDPKGVLADLVRIGRRAVVSFPNFGHWRVRWHLLTRGRMPVTRHLTYQWYDTPNIHFCTILDFLALCGEIGVEIERGLALDEVGRVQPYSAVGRRANLMAAQAMFVLRRR